MTWFRRRPRVKEPTKLVPHRAQSVPQPPNKEESKKENLNKNEQKRPDDPDGL